MKTLYKNIFLLFLGAAVFTACEEKDERTVFPHSTPVIENASVSAVGSINTSEVFAGDSIDIKATVKDPLTPLSTLRVKVVIANRLVVDEKIRTAGQQLEVTKRVQIPFVRELADGVYPEIFLDLENVEGDLTEVKLSDDVNVSIRRPELPTTLYLVTSEKQIIQLTKSDVDNEYDVKDLDIKGNSLSFKVAEKITDDNEIDYSGFVWGENNGLFEPSNEMSNFTTVKDTQYKSIERITFNVFSFESAISGKRADPGILYLEDFADVTVSGESFKKLDLTWAKNQEITLNGDLASYDVVLNPTFFERISADKAKFLGNDGNWSVYYNPVRKNVIVAPEEPAYPAVLVGLGFGMGYPTKVTSDQIKVAYPHSDGRTTTSWDNVVGQVLGYVYLRQSAANIYEGVIYLPGDNNDYANFKFFENHGWANEKKSTDFTFSGADVIEAVASDGNWQAKTGIEHGNYKFTINLSAKTVNIVKVTLP